MLHEIAPHRFNNEFLAHKTVSDNDFILHFQKDSIFLKTNGNGLEIPRKKDFGAISDQTETIFLFRLNDVPCFLVWDEIKTDNPQLIYQNISFFRQAKEQEVAWISLAGFHLRNWYAQNRFCGMCGTRMQHKADERALVCPNCKNTVYPKISPAIIVAITCNDRILLARNANFPGHWFSLIAGYADVGESLEETVVREVKEEVGIDVWNIRYYKSQPWPLSGSVMIGFVAEADENQPIRIDDREIAEAAWFKRGSVPPHPLKISIAGEMIEKFEKGEL